MKCTRQAYHPSASHRHSSGTAPSYPFLHLLQRLTPYSLLTNKQRTGLPQAPPGEAGDVGPALAALLALSTSLAIREQLGKTPSRLYLEKGGGGKCFL